MNSRFDYVGFDIETLKLQEELKNLFEQIENKLDLEFGLSSRELSLSITKLEETWMWVGKALKRKQINKNITKELKGLK